MSLKDYFTPVKSMEADEARDFIRKHREGSFTILDVRQPGEYEQEHIPGAKLIPLPKLSDSLTELTADKPTIVYCAIGGRSRVAAQLLSGRGFNEVYNLKGGIKAWNGAKAAGPREFHLTFLRQGQTPEAMLMLTQHMEEGLRSFYLTMAQRTPDQELGELFADLAAYEELHKKRIMAICRELGLTDQDISHKAEESIAEVIEGGFDKDQLITQNEPYLKTPADVLNIAMMIETQALDIFLRLADEVASAVARQFLINIADEEEKHLATLAQLIEKKS